MFLVGILSWWYSDGFTGRLRIIKERLVGCVDFFSIKLLLSTLFAPFRQISAGSVSGPIGDQIHAFFDRLISRFIGMFVRLFMIIAGLFVILAQTLFGIVLLLSWLIMPFLPVIGLIMMIIGWVPQWMI
ncbi:MAG: hypothetical protein WCJ36_03505 [Candidatus Saccharibacteria bacterium]